MLVSRSAFRTTRSQTRKYRRACRLDRLAIDPFTGQGVFLALTGAELAAEALLTALRDPAREREAFEAYARRRGQDITWRRALSRAVALLIDVPFLARRVAERLERFPAARAALVNALTGIDPPQSAFRPAVLGRLIA